jgi:hypothetical protein
MSMGSSCIQLSSSPIVGDDTGADDGGSELVRDGRSLEVRDNGDTSGVAGRSICALADIWSAINGGRMSWISVFWNVRNADDIVEEMVFCISPISKGGAKAATGSLLTKRRG